MLLNGAGRLVKKLDFRGTKIEYLDKVSAKELFLIMAAAEQLVNSKDNFKAKDLAPKGWDGTAYEPIMTACKECVKEPDKVKQNAAKLFGVVIKQALIMSPLLFRQTSGEWEGATYKRESLDF